MSAIIYETINVYNKERDILPYKYIGSDQHNDNKYLGSNKQLLKDIKILGKENFEKRIICEFKDDISNILLRKIESNIQKEIDVANNPEYYNRTNTSHKGYVETEKEKNIRMNKTHLKRKLWWDNLTDEEKKSFKEKTSERFKIYSLIRSKQTKNKTYEEIYGIEKAKILKTNFSGSKNHKSKKIIEIKSGKIFETIISAMEYYKVKKYDTIRSWCKKGEKIKFI